MKTSALARTRNRALRTELRGAIKDLRAETSQGTAATKLRAVTRLLDRAAGYKLIHRKNADRNKSRLALMVKKIA